MQDAVNEQIPNNERLPGSQARRTNMLLAGLMAVALGMFGFAYANAEFFVMICQEIGLISKDSTAVKGVIADAEEGRDLDVYFSGHVADNLPIAFQVKKSFQKTAINRAMVNDYTFRNMSDEVIYFRPVHDVSPLKAGAPETMVLEQCFCFTEQKILPGQAYTLPVKYTFTDQLEDGVYSIKMNYTLFRSTQAQYEASQAAYAAGKEQYSEAHRAVYELQKENGDGDE